MYDTMMCTKCELPMHELNSAKQYNQQSNDQKCEKFENQYHGVETPSPM